MITKSIVTDYGTVESTVNVEHTDNGQIVLKIVSMLNGKKHEHSYTVGAIDGQDAVSKMTEDELRKMIQDHIDKVRDDAAVILMGRAKVAKITENLK